MTREELLRSKEYWIGEIQFNLYKLLNKYMEENNLSRKDLADKLGVSKSYISQIFNGDFDHRISKFVELSLMIGKVPKVEFKDISKVLADDVIDFNDERKIG